MKRKRLDKENSNIVIVGSGLAGLSAAISLEQAGFLNITIVERDDNFERQKEGYGLTLTYNPKGPLASLGVLETVACQDCPSRSHYLFQVSFWKVDHERSPLLHYVLNPYDFTQFFIMFLSLTEVYWDTLEIPFRLIEDMDNEAIFVFLEKY